MAAELEGFTPEEKDNLKAKFGGDSKGVTFITPLCHSCKRWRKDLTCDAYPEGIPQGILIGAIDHKTKYEGDGGLKYDPVD